MPMDRTEERAQPRLCERCWGGCHCVHAPRLDPRSEARALSVAIALRPIVPCGAVDLMAVVQVRAVLGILWIDLVGGAVNDDAELFANRVNGAHLRARAEMLNANSTGRHTEPDPAPIEEPVNRGDERRA